MNFGQNHIKEMLLVF